MSEEDLDAELSIDLVSFLDVAAMLFSSYQEMFFGFMPSELELAGSRVRFMILFMEGIVGMTEACANASVSARPMMELACMFASGFCVVRSDCKLDCVWV